MFSTGRLSAEMMLKYEVEYASPFERKFLVHWSTLHVIGFEEYSKHSVYLLTLLKYTTDILLTIAAANSSLVSSTFLCRREAGLYVHSWYY